jgi:hypothetical protein
MTRNATDASDPSEHELAVGRIHNHDGIDSSPPSSGAPPLSLDTIDPD